jgi:tetratricopeptide (TPR) repeat protein
MAKSKVRTITSKQTLKQRIPHFFLSGLVILALTALVLLLVNNKDAGLKRKLLEDWENGSYTGAFEESVLALEKKPLDSFLLTINGFAAYQLAVSQINSADTLFYLNNCIWSLRKALHKKNADKEGRIRYVLGKAYYEKGRDFSDLAVRYLEEAQDAGYAAKDIPEYLGLSYETVGKYRKSVEALSAALDPSGGAVSARLLLAIARSYISLEDWDNARAYLTRCVEEAKDSAQAISARLMLGKMLRNSGDLAAAEAVFNEILETAENAEAAFELGEIYAEQDNIYKARAAWRRSLRADNNYLPARRRLNM